jgi:hypothetical protein
MNSIERALRDFLRASASWRVALVGGIAVSVRTEPRFTRDLDFAVAVADDRAAEIVVFELQRAGYQTQTVLQHSPSGRLATVRLRKAPRTPIVDLLFASSGIESEITEDAEALEVMKGVAAPVARTGHLIALKLLSRDDDGRPQDHGDLRALAKIASPEDWARADRAVHLITSRGFSRGRDLVAALAALHPDHDAPH